MRATISIIVSKGPEMLLEKNLDTASDRRRSVSNKDYKVDFSYKEDLNASYTVIQLTDNSVLKQGTVQLKKDGRKQLVLHVDLNK